MKHFDSDAERDKRMQEYLIEKERYQAKTPEGFNGTKWSSAIRFRPPYNQRYCRMCKMYLTSEGWHVAIGRYCKMARERCKLCGNIVIGPRWSTNDPEKMKRSNRPLLGSHCVLLFPSKLNTLTDQNAIKTSTKKTANEPLLIVASPN